VAPCESANPGAPAVLARPLTLPTPPVSGPAVVSRSDSELAANLMKAGKSASLAQIHNHIKGYTQVSLAFPPIPILCCMRTPAFSELALSIRFSSGTRLPARPPPLCAPTPQPSCLLFPEKPGGRSLPPELDARQGTHAPARYLKEQTAAWACGHALVPPSNSLSLSNLLT